MHNVAIFGKCFDGNNVLLDLKYQMYFPRYSLTSQSFKTKDRQFLVNTGDPINLGHLKRLELGDEIFIFFNREKIDGTLDKTIKKRLLYNGSATLPFRVVYDIDLEFSTDVSYDYSDNKHKIMPNININKNTVTDVLYRIYYKIEDNVGDQDWLEIEVINKKDMNTLYLEFFKTGTFKVECYSVDNLFNCTDVSEVVFNINKVQTTLGVRKYMEWEG
jgi:hypothetical protein